MMMQKEFAALVERLGLERVCDEFYERGSGRGWEPRDCCDTCKATEAQHDARQLWLRVQELEADAATFQEAYRLKSDVQSKASLVRAEQAEARVAALEAKLCCKLDLDSPSFPPMEDERRQCGCDWCRRVLAEARVKELEVERNDWREVYDELVRLLGIDPDEGDRNLPVATLEAWKRDQDGWKEKWRNDKDVWERERDEARRRVQVLEEALRKIDAALGALSTPAYHARHARLIAQYALAPTTTEQAKETT